MTALCIVALCAGPVAVGAPASVQPALDIHVGQADAFSRIEFHWAGAARMDVKRAGQLLTLSFSRDAKPDIATLKSVPMKWVKSVDVRHEHGRIVFAITLTDDADAATGNADGADFVNVFAKAAPPPAPPSPQTPPPTRPDPVPQGGVVQMKVTQDGGQLKLDFPWRNPLGAAVFRRGDAIWIVFDAAAKIDLTQAPKNVTQFSSMQALSGPGYSAIRIATRSPVPFEVANLGSDWTVILEPTAQVPFVPVKLTRDDSAGPAALTAALSGATGVYWVDDPVVGDKVAVVTAQAPAKGIPIPHDFVQFTVLQSAQGMAVSSNADDLAVTFSGDIVTISRPKGLALSPTTNPQDMASSVNAPKPAAMPGLIGDDWSATGGAGYLARYDALVMPVADEEEKGAEGPTEGHMALARYLIGQGLAFEAIGVLNDAFRTHPALGGEAEFRALRGMARAMAGRYKEAETDLSAPVLDDNPAANLWRGYVLAKTSQWTDAKKAFTAGSTELATFPAYWRQRFSRAAALTALALNDIPGARSWIDFALDNKISPDENAQNQLVDAEVDQGEGDAATALRKYQALAALPLDQVAGPAQLRATQMQLASNAITPSQAIDTYDGLRYRWRGDAFELDTVRALGQLYLSQGRYREALEAFRSAGKDLPDLPETAQLQADLTNAFKTLFLEGQADGLQPIQALALFYDFKELTPVGADGDAMVRRLTRRLVDVDLLPQAEELLKYQVDNRLEGVPKAQVATDLAVIDLMDRKPEDALDAINGSRTTVLPQPLNLQRRIVAARALTGLGQYDTALEMLGSDTSADATDARAEIVWDQKAWPQAGAIFEKQLGDRYKDPRALTEIQEGQLLRAAVAYSLAGDDASLTRLRQRFTPFIDGARDPAALRVALAGLNGGDVAPSDFSRISADNQLFAGWVAQMKSRFDQAPLPAPRSPQVARQAAADAPGPGKG